MIIIRFFTGVTIRYPEANLFRNNDGVIEICKAGHSDLEENNAVKILAIVQPTAGAVVEANDFGILTHPQFPEKKSLWEEVFGHKANQR